LSTCQESCCINNDYDTIKNERDNYKSQLGTKDQKITELENNILELQSKCSELETEIRELKNKPPVSPVNTPDKSEDNSSQEPSNFLVEKAKLLNTINRQKGTIEKLQRQLQQVKTQEPQTIIKEIPTVDLTAINQLGNQLKSKEITIRKLHLIYLTLLGISTLFILILIYLKTKKKAK